MQLQRAERVGDRALVVAGSGGTRVCRERLVFLLLLMGAASTAAAAAAALRTGTGTAGATTTACARSTGRGGGVGGDTELADVQALVGGAGEEDNFVALFMRTD